MSKDKVNKTNDNNKNIKEYKSSENSNSETKIEQVQDEEVSRELLNVISGEFRRVEELEEKFKHLSTKVYTVISFASVVTLLGISNVVLFPRTFSGLNDFESLKTLLSSLTLIIIYNLSILTVIFWVLYWVKKYIIGTKHSKQHFIVGLCLTTISCGLIIATYVTGFWLYNLGITNVSREVFNQRDKQILLKDKKIQRDKVEIEKLVDQIKMVKKMNK